MKRPGGAQTILDCLHQEGVRHLFLVPGLTIDPILAAFSNSGGIQPLVCAHELGAAFMADGYARMREGVGACCSIAGCGAANMIPAAVTARMDLVPVLYITGAFPRALRERGAFQDGGKTATRDQALFNEAAGLSLAIDSPADVAPKLCRAMNRLRGTPPGPAHLSLAYDVLTQPAPHAESEAPDVPRKPLPLDEQVRLETVAPILNHATRLAVLAGREAGGAKAVAAVTAFAENFGVPVATTLDAKGVFPPTHPLHIGNFGYGGNPRATTALLDANLEVLIVIGAELDERNTLCWDERLLSSKRKLIQIRPVPLRPADQTSGSIYFQMDCALGLCSLNQWKDSLLGPLSRSRESRRPWLESILSIPLEAAWPPDIDDGNADRLHPARLILEMRDRLPKDTALFLDSGIHRLFAGHFWQACHRKGLITAAKTAPMGWAIAAAIGGQLACTGHPVAVLTGDGCMLMHGMELATAARYRVPVLFVVSNNASMAVVYNRFKRIAPRAQDHARLMDIDWAAFAALFGIPSRRVKDRAGLADALAAAAARTGPFLIDVLTRVECQVPMHEHAVYATQPGVWERIVNDNVSDVPANPDAVPL